MSEPITAIGASTTASSMNGGRANATGERHQQHDGEHAGDAERGECGTEVTAQAHPHARHEPDGEHERGGEPEVHPSFSGSISRGVGVSSWTRSTSASVSMPMT